MRLVLRLLLLRLEALRLKLAPTPLPRPLRARGWQICAALLALLLPPAAFATEEAPHRHAIAMHGEPALGPDFAHLPYANPDAPKGGAFRMGVAGTFDSLNVLALKGNAPRALIPFILQPLMMRSEDEPFTLYGLIAQSIATPEDRSYVEFRLNPAARFADGKPVLAQDVAFSWNLLTSKGRETYRRNGEKVARIDIRDAHTLRFTFKAVGDRELPLIIAMMPVFAAHATDPETFERMGFTPFLGTGPYALESLEPGARLVLKKRSDYWAKDLPIHRGLYNFDTITLEFFRDSNTMFEAFKTGALDYRLELDPTKWRQGYDFPAINEGRVLREEIRSAAPKGMSGFVFNSRREVFAQRDVREAFFYLFDFEWINTNLFSNLYRRTASFFDESALSMRGQPLSAREAQLLGEASVAQLPEAIRAGNWHPPVTDGSGRDRAVMRNATTLFARAGYQITSGVMRAKTSGAPLGFEILVVSREQERLALAFADTLKQVGIFPRIRLVDSSQYWLRVRQFDFDMLITSFVVSASPGQEQLNRWSARAADAPGTLNYAGVREGAIDHVLEALLAAQTPEDFTAATRALDRLLLAGYYVLPLYHAPGRWVARWRHIARPARAPTYDLTYESFWREP